MIEEPNIKITYDSKELNPIYFGDRNSTKKEKIEENIKSFMIGRKISELPMITFREKIEIEALNFGTNEFEIYNYIIDERGNIVTELDINSFTSSSVENGKSEFTFDRNIDMDEYYDFTVEGKSIHCLFMRAKVDKSYFGFATLVLGQ